MKRRRKLSDYEKGMIKGIAADMWGVTEEDIFIIDSFIDKEKERVKVLVENDQNGEMCFVTFKRPDEMYKHY